MSGLRSCARQFRRADGAPKELHGAAAVRSAGERSGTNVLVRRSDAAEDPRVKAAHRNALKVLFAGDVTCASTRSNFLWLEDNGYAERYLKTEVAKVWRWRITTKGREALLETRT